MAKDLLLEIGLEEVPARFVRGAINQLKDKIEKWLESERIEHGEIEWFATPRRLAVLVHDTALKQKDIKEEAKGPSRKIAQDEAGNWSKAALGFARSQGVETEQLYFKELAGVEYVYATKSSVGINTEELLSEGLKNVIISMSFPKNMRWGGYDLKFVRPIRWMIALFGEEVVPFTITGVDTGKVTRGHRFLGTDITVENPSLYKQLLREQFVIVDIAEREQMIVSQLEDLMEKNSWSITIKEDLLEEVLFLVEYPNVLFGSFDESFLTIPQEVLITSMREHQRYFPVFDQTGSLLPYFVTVRNGDKQSLDVVAKGNEKVLRARLSDAKFFYEEDHKLTIEHALSKLESIVYHEELGTVADKVRRVTQIAQAISEQLSCSKEETANVKRAAEICKFDLVSQMVYEFPELQGIMGEDYALKLGEHAAVAKAVNEHYMPRFSGDQVPSELTGAIVSLADKIDTIVGCFSIGIVPTGSQDPYALRRQAAGIVQIMLAYNMELRLSELYSIAINEHLARGMKRTEEEVRHDLKDFLALRIKNWLSEHGARYDVIDAVMAVDIDDLRRITKRAAAVFAQLSGEEKANFKLTVEAFNRVVNLAAKAEHGDIDIKLFSEQTESELYAAWQKVRPAFIEAIENAEMKEALAQLSSLKPVIHNYFENVMVMAEDENVRRNRLATLFSIGQDIKKLADFSKLVW